MKFRKEFPLVNFDICSETLVLNDFAIIVYIKILKGKIVWVYHKYNFFLS